MYYYTYTYVPTARVVKKLPNLCPVRRHTISRARPWESQVIWRQRNKNDLYLTPCHKLSVTLWPGKALWSNYEWWLLLSDYLKSNLHDVRGLGSHKAASVNERRVRTRIRWKYAICRTSKYFCCILIHAIYQYETTLSELCSVILNRHHCKTY